jgi:hypothetical protein
MIEHEFVFDGSTAIVRRIADKEIMLSQPGLPGESGLTPWANEEQAREWVYHQFADLFRDYTPEPEPGPEPIPPETPESGA